MSLVGDYGQISDEEVEPETHGTKRLREDSSEPVEDQPAQKLPRLSEPVRFLLPFHI